MADAEQVHEDMPTTTIQGYDEHSVQVTGPITSRVFIPPDEETRLPHHEGVLAFSNGVLIRARNGNEGIWRFTPNSLPEPHQATVTVQQSDGNVNHSIRDDVMGDDVAVIRGPVEWLVVGDVAMFEGNYDDRDD